MKRITPR